MNRLKCLLICAMILAGTVTAFSNGTLIDDSFYSSILDRDQFVDVYLPDGYDPEDTSLRYSVVYFLHGGFQDHNGYPYMIDVLDSMIGTQIDAVILVKPGTNIDLYSTLSWYSNSELLGMIEDYVTQDLIAYIDSEYNTDPSRTKRAIMGHSMGGYGCMKIALKHPDLYRAVAAHAGVLDLTTCLDITVPLALDENGGSGPFNPEAGVWSQVLFSTSAAFSPNLDNPPYYVDLPVDNIGSSIDSVRQRWVQHDPPHLAHELDPTYDLEIYFDCGTADAWIAAADAFSLTLDSLSIPYHYGNHSGDHNNRLEEQMAISFAHLDSVFWDGIARAVQTSVEPPYAEPGVQNVQVTSTVVNPGGHPLTVTASFRNRGGVVVQTINLANSGGDTWTASATAPNDESHYSIDMTVMDNVSATEQHRRSNARFTTIGPLVVDQVSTVQEIIHPGDAVMCRVTLRNEGQTGLAGSILATIATSEPWVTITGTAEASFPNIPAGQTSAQSGFYRMTVDDQCPAETDLVFQLSIASEGDTYWSDSFTLHVSGLGAADTRGFIPDRTTLNQNHPNPFNSSTRIEFNLAAPAHASLDVLDITGRSVSTLIDDNLNAGSYSLPFDAGQLPTGIYIARLRTGSLISCRKMILLK